METLFLKTDNYCIYKADNDSTFDLIDFVVKTNYGRYKNISDFTCIQDEIDLLYTEELLLTKLSTIYIARDNNNIIIGAIRVLKWDKQQKLPIHKLFNINPLNRLPVENDTSFWHIGRFAINSCSGINTVNLFKQLMLCAIDPIIKCNDSYMIAETDVKLLKVMAAMGIKTWKLGDSINYLASETVPIYSNNKGLETFYNKY
ncbi:MAG: hypothetical protein R3Y59_10605 [bacterium]